MRKLLNAIAGFAIPIRITSRLYLADRLAHYGVEVKRLPDACLQELADDIMETVRPVAAATHRSWREIVTFHLDRAALDIARQLLGESPLDPSLTAYLDHFAAIMRRHGVSVPLNS